MVGNAMEVQNQLQMFALKFVVIAFITALFQLIAMMETTLTLTVAVAHARLKMVSLLLDLLVLLLLKPLTRNVMATITVTWIVIVEPQVVTVAILLVVLSLVGLVFHLTPQKMVQLVLKFAETASTMIQHQLINLLVTFAMMETQETMTVVLVLALLRLDLHALQLLTHQRIPAMKYVVMASTIRDTLVMTVIQTKTMDVPQLAQLT
jgi:hypothetical protein